MRDALDGYETHIGEKPLLTHVLSKYWEELAKPWNQDTQKGYIFYYKNQIVPHFLEKPLEEYDRDDVDVIMEKIQSEKRARGEKEYSEATMGKLGYLIRRAVRIAKEKGVISVDFLWGTGYSVSQGQSDKAVRKKLAILKKSLSTEEEIKIGRKLLNDPMQDGEKMGLALMFALGIRNAEACGLNYGAVCKMRDYPGSFAVLIYQTTIGESNQLKGGGKTSNAPRKLPLPDKLYHLLETRKKEIERKIALGEIDLPDGMRNIEDLPIACKGSQYTIRCSSRDLRNAGSALFAEVMDKSKEEALGYIDREMENKNILAEMGLEEKDPTVYLFRRNLGTHLRLLGLHQTEIEAFMGHAILDGRAERNDFENEDLVFEVKEMLERRPVVGTTVQKESLSTDGQGKAIDDRSTMGRHENVIEAYQRGYAAVEEKMEEAEKKRQKSESESGEITTGGESKDTTD